MVQAKSTAGEFHQRKMQARPIQTYGCGRYQNVADVDVRLNSPGVVPIRKKVRMPGLRQFFHGNRGRRAADTVEQTITAFTIQLSAVR